MWAMIIGMPVLQSGVGRAAARSHMAAVHVEAMGVEVAVRVEQASPPGPRPARLPVPLDLRESERRVPG